MRSHSVATPLLITLDPNFFSQTPAVRASFLAWALAMNCVRKLRSEELRCKTAKRKLPDAAHSAPKGIH